MKPKVSIIVPVYNLEFYVERCLNSLVSQIFPHPFEVIVVNDGSSDDSRLIVDEFAVKYKTVIRAFSKENGGHGAACNFGIERARGSYVLFVDGDDFLESPSIVREMYDKAVATGADLLIGNLRYHFADHCEPFRPLPHIDGERLLDEDDKRRLYRNWATPCARLYRASLFRDADFRYLEGVMFADVNFAPKSYLLAEKIFYSNTEWYDYDLTRPGQSMKATNRKVLDVIPALVDMLEFYRKKGAFESRRRELEYFTINHVLSWTARIVNLRDYPVDRAFAELFQVLEDYFPDWVDGSELKELRPNFVSRMQIRIARATGYTTYRMNTEAVVTARKYFDRAADSRIGRKVRLRRVARGIKRTIKGAMSPA